MRSLRLNADTVATRSASVLDVALKLRTTFSRSPVLSFTKCANEGTQPLALQCICFDASRMLLMLYNDKPNLL